MASKGGEIITAEWGDMLHLEFCSLAGFRMRNTLRQVYAHQECLWARVFSFRKLRRGFDGGAEILQAQIQSGFEIDPGFPSEKRFGFGDVGLALRGIVLRQGMEDDLTARSGYTFDGAGAIENCPF